eukprot:2373793-Alexandrium_andersonii.AAC.1
MRLPRSAEFKNGAAFDNKWMFKQLRSFGTACSSNFGFSELLVQATSDFRNRLFKQLRTFGVA